MSLNSNSTSTSTSDRPPPRTRRGVETRAALVAAARSVFVRDSFLAARITDICEEAGVATGTFYTYFTDKDAAFAAVLQASEDEMLHPHLSEQGEGKSPAARIEAANRAYLESYRRNADLMALTYQVSAISEEYRDVLRRRGESFYRRNARSIKHLQAQGLADPDLDAYETSRALSGMVSRIAHATYVLGESTPLETLVQTLTRLWINALRIPVAEKDEALPTVHGPEGSAA